MEKILVAGGAGYIGSHLVLELQEQGYEVIVLDNFLTGSKRLVHASCAEGDLENRQFLRELFKEHSFSGVFHFAASSQVAESVQKPEKYYLNNVSNTIHLLHTMIEFGVKNVIFSSTACVYGEPEKNPVTEDFPVQPINPYGISKAMIENILKDLNLYQKLEYVVFRYFNACGADLKGRAGEMHDPETHLIPLVLKTAAGKREKFTIFGDDFPTPDGTCIRDYIHVTDLAKAHVLAYEYLKKGGKSDIFNLSTSRGISVKEIVNLCKEITQKEFKVEIGSRRAGDSAILMASYEKAQKVLGWKPQISIETIIESAWKWEQSLS